MVAAVAWQAGGLKSRGVKTPQSGLSPIADHHRCDQRGESAARHGGQCHRSKWPRSAAHSEGCDEILLALPLKVDLHDLQPCEQGTGADDLLLAESCPLGTVMGFGSCMAEPVSCPGVSPAALTRPSLQASCDVACSTLQGQRACWGCPHRGFSQKDITCQWQSLGTTATACSPWHIPGWVRMVCGD